MQRILCLPLIAVFLSGSLSIPARSVPPKYFEWFALDGYELAQKGLMRAIVNGDTLSVALLLDKGVKINAVDAVYRDTPLILAIRYKRIPIIRLLVSRDADVTSQDTSDMTVLHYAADLGNTEVLKLLLEHGAQISVNMLAWGEVTPLHLATQNSSTEGVRLLLDHDAKPNVSDVTGRTQLMSALERGEMEMLHLLLDRGANPDVQDNEGWTPLMLAVTGSFLQDNEVGKIRPSGFRREALRLLIAKHVNLNLRNLHGETALILALLQGNQELAGALEKAGASTEGANEARLVYAVEQKDREAVVRLLEAGTSPNISYHHQDTPLIRAASNGDAATVRALLAKGAEVNARGKHDSPALFQAVRNPEIARMLLDAGANIRLMDTSGNTVFTYALTTGDAHPDIIKLLLDRGFSVNPSYKGVTALMLAAKSNNAEVVRVLLERNADPAAQDEAGNTALHYAVRPYEGVQEVRPVLIALLDKGANINARNRSGETPLRLALENDSRLNSQDIQFLRQRGATTDPAKPGKDKP